MPYISVYTIVEDDTDTVYHVRLTDGEDHYDSIETYDLPDALERLEAMKRGDGIHG